MNAVLCPVCDYELELAPVDVPATLLQALGVDNAGVDTGGAELAMAEHLAEHTVLEWVTAMRMADLFIEKVENDARTLAHQVQELTRERDHWRAVGEQKVALQHQARNNAVQNGYGATMPAQPDFGAEWEQLSPRERQERLAEDRRNGVTRTISDSLIPFIPPGQRAEGVVGRRR